MGIETQNILLRVSLRLASIVAFAQARISLCSSTAHAVHPLLRRLLALFSDELICQSRTSCPVVSFSSTLDGDVQVPSFGTQGRRNRNPPKPHTHTQKRGFTWVHVGNGIAPCCEVLPALATPHKPSPFCCRCFLSQTPRFDPNFKSSIYCRKLPPPFSLFYPYHFRFCCGLSVPGADPEHSPQAAIAYLRHVPLTENGCLPQAATRPSARQVRPHPCSLQDKTALFTLGASAKTGPSHPDELPALRSGTLWISRYRNIVDYPRKLSAGEWDLDRGLSRQQKADSIV